MKLTVDVAGDERAPHVGQTLARERVLRSRELRILAAKIVHAVTASSLLSCSRAGTRVGTWTPSACPPASSSGVPSAPRERWSQRPRPRRRQLLERLSSDILPGLWPGFIAQDLEVWVNPVYLRRHLAGRKSDYVARVASFNQQARDLAQSFESAAAVARLHGRRTHVTTIMRVGEAKVRRMLARSPHIVVQSLGGDADGVGGEE